MPTPPVWYAGQDWTAADAEEITPGAWQALSLLNGWTNRTGQVAAQIRMVNSVAVEVVGTITAGTVTAGTVLFDVPTGFAPQNDQIFPAVEWQTANGQAPLVVQPGPPGNVIILNAVTAGCSLSFGFTYWLDC